MKTIAVWLLIFVFSAGSSTFGQTAEDASNSGLNSTLDRAAELMDAGEHAEGFKVVHDYLESDARTDSEEVTARHFLNVWYQETGDFQSAIEELRILQGHATDPLEKSDLFEEMAFCYEELGDAEQAARYRKGSEIYYHMSHKSPPYRSNGPGWRVILDNWLVRFLPAAVSSQSWVLPTIYMGSGLLAWLLLSVLNLFTGRRQAREARGSTRRWVFASVVVAFMQIVPLLLLCILLAVTSKEVGLGSAFWATFITVPIVTLCLGNMLLPPARWLGSKEEMKEVGPNIDGFQEQLLASAATMQIAPPVVRIIPSFGVLEVQAFAGGLPQPSIAISDGTILRLEPKERDAIVAHEMGHIANGSLWWYPGVFSVCGLVTVLVSLKFSTWMAMAYGLAMYTGLFRIVSRYFEYSCDRLAGQAVGFAEMVNALRKTHATLIIKNTGWKSILAYSMATHPSVEERLSALHAHASEDQKPEVTWSEKTAHRRHVGSLIAAAAWGLTMVLCLIPPANSILATLQYVALMTVIFLPGFLLRSALREEVTQDINRRQVPGKSPGSWFWIVLLMCVGIWLGIASSKADFGTKLYEIFSGMFGLFLVLFLFFLFVQLLFGKRDVNSKIILAMHQKRWQDALDLGEKHSRQINTQVDTLHSLVLCRWLAGDRNKALYDLERLKKVFPAFKQSWITEACLRSELLEHKRVLELAREVMPDLKQDTMPHLLAARSLIHLGQLDEAEAELLVVEKLSPESPSLQIIRAKIASDKQQPELAWEFIKVAHELLPGDPGVLVTEAEVEIRFGSPEKAEQLLKQARILLDAAPFTLYDWRYYDVLEKLQRSQNGPICEAGEIG